MIVPEEILKEIFSQLPILQKQNNKPHTYGWGNQNALNLFLVTRGTLNKYPIIWLIESENIVDMYAHNLTRNIRLVIANVSTKTTNTNELIWNTDFKDLLNPFFENVLTALKKSGVTTILGDYKVQRFANYTDDYFKSQGLEKSKTFAIDPWNAIVFDAKIRFEEKANGTAICINQIKF